MYVRKTRALRDKFLRRTFEIPSKPGALLFLRFLIIFFNSLGETKFEAFKLKSFRFLEQESKDLDQGVVNIEDSE